MYLANRIQVFLELHKNGFIFHLDLTLLSIVKNKDTQLQIFVAFSEILNFNIKRI